MDMDLTPSKTNSNSILKAIIVILIGTLILSLALNALIIYKINTLINDLKEALTIKAIDAQNREQTISITEAIIQLQKTQNIILEKVK